MRQVICVCVLGGGGGGGGGGACETTTTKQVDRLSDSAMFRTLQRGMGIGQTSSSLGPQAAPPGQVLYNSIHPGQMNMAGVYYHPPPASVHPSMASSAISGAGAGAGAGAAAVASEAPLGTATRPIHMIGPEPSSRSQLWSTIRTLGLWFIIISGIEAFLEDKGITKSFGLNSEVTPVKDTKVTACGL